jgi:hypothetical protein
MCAVATQIFISPLIPIFISDQPAPAFLDPIFMSELLPQRKINTGVENCYLYPYYPVVRGTVDKRVNTVFQIVEPCVSISRSTVL